MAVIPGGLPDMLVRLGTALHDTTLSESANGSRITRATAARELNAAQRNVFRRLMRARVDSQRIGVWEFTLTQDANDTSRYALPPRCQRVLWVKDASDVYYDSLDSHNLGNSGIMLSGRYIDFTNATPTGAVTAKCVLEPAEMSYGASAATSGATALLLASSPTIGNNVLTPNYYISATVGFETGTAAGYTALCTAFTVSTRTLTVPTMSPAPSASGEYYSILCGLPECLWDAVALLAAYECCKWDEGLSTRMGPKGLQMLKEDFEDAYKSGLGTLNSSLAGHVETPRRGVWDPFQLCRE